MNMEQRTVVFLLIAAVLTYYLYVYKVSIKDPSKTLEGFMDALAIDPQCKDMTPATLLSKYNGDLMKLSDHLNSIGVTPDMLTDARNIPKLATVLKLHGLITCP